MTRSLDNILNCYMAALEYCHSQGECGCDTCPYCQYERQFPGKPYYRLTPPEQARKERPFRGEGAARPPEG